MNILKVFPTNRAVRKSFEGLNDLLLPKSISIGEFEKKIVIVKNKREIDSDNRILLLKKASEFSNFKKLKIKREYLSFLKSSDFIFGFFEELAIEKVNIEDIDTNDTYAEYSEHLSILSELLKNYKNLLNDKGYYDKTVLPNIYEINNDYIKRFDQIELFLEGYLSTFEIELFLKISKKVQFLIIFETNIYNKKMTKKFQTLGFNLQDNFRYKLDLSNKKIIKKTPINNSIENIELFLTKNRIEQIGYMLKKIYDFIKSGILPEEIVLIIPDESFAKFLNDFDTNNIFNFAMGIPYEESFLYKKVEALYRYLDEKNNENRYRFKRYFKDDEANKIILSTKNNQNIENFLKSFIENEKLSEESIIYNEEIFKFKRLEEELKKYSVKEMLYLFLSRLKDRKIDDKRGGKVTVMGVLESRLIEFKVVLIVDFNEEIVPKKSQKELFLSTDIRKKSGLPTKEDRENLQKQYYHQILSKAEKIAISAIENDTLKPSRFLDELNIKKIKTANLNHKKIFDILKTNKNKIKREEVENIKMEYDFSKIPISSTLLKTYLECKRKYYFKYIKKIKEFKIPSNNLDDREIGIKLHSYLKRLYEKKDFYQDENSILTKLSSFVHNETKNSIEMKLQLDIWLEILKKFAKNETERFEEGYRVLHKEIKLKSNFEGFDIFGIIDRIDIKDDKLSLIDYKTGTIQLSTIKNLEKTTDFQMEFYYLLANKLKSVEEAGFYDLKNGNIKKETFLKEKIEILKQNLQLLKQKEQNFTKCEDIKTCQYCPYTTLCGRDI